MRHISRQRLLARQLSALTLVLALAFVLRLYRLDAVPLRGDEAFAVRYWASSPVNILESQWGESEPHPFGTFLAFWRWKHAAGDSEFAMRYLPLLGDLVGVAAMAALARRVFKDDLTAYLAALLWAINPFQIWHAQDVRNYALWAGISPLAMWLFIRATDSRRRRDWALYVVVEALALYIFFLESFMLVVQAIYLLVLRRSHPVLRRAFVAWSVLGILLIPWFVHLWWLSGSGYTGAVRDASLPDLLTWFLPVLLIGDEPAAPWHTLLPLAWIALVTLGLAGQQLRRDRRLWWLVAWITIPTILLLIAASRMSVFHPRYLIAVTPALLLLMARAIRLFPSGYKRSLIVVSITLLVTPLIGFNTLYDYYRGENAKSPDWPRLATYLEYRARPGDDTQPGDLIVQLFADPAFNYYYRDGVTEISLFPDVPVIPQLVSHVNYFHGFWTVGRSPEVDEYLNNRLQFIGDINFSNFTVVHYRPRQIFDDEIEHGVDVTFGNAAHLEGYTILGPDPNIPAITVLLYWGDPPRSLDGTDDTVYKASVQLLGPDSPTLRDQGQDHPPIFRRDVYHLLTNPTTDLAPGEYTIQVLVYEHTDPEAPPGPPLPVTVDGTPAGNSYPLMSFTWPLP